MSLQDYKAKINELIKAHLAGEEGAADQAFILLCENDWTRQKKWRHVMLTGEHLNEIESVYIDAFMNGLEKFDPERGDFVHYVNRSVENRIRNLGMDRKKRHERHAFESSWQPSNRLASFWEGMQAEFADTNEMIRTPEDIVLEDLTKEDKLTFIPVIAKDMIDKMTDEQFGIASVYMQTGSYRETGKAVGVSHMKVQRTLDKLAQIYDLARFGDIHRYFTVNTVKSRG